MKRLIPILMAAAMLLPARAQDWPGVNRYAQANAQLTQPVKVVLIGDSITDGWPAARPDFFSTTGYIGRGISGQVSTQMLARFMQDVVSLHPKVVVINAGTNDIAENQGTYNPELTFRSIEAMARLAQSNGIRPILTSVLPAAGFRWRPAITDSIEKIAALNERIRQLAADHKWIYIDYHTVLAKDGGIPEEYSFDGVHPTPAGYSVMEPLVIEAVKKAQKAWCYGKK